MSVILLTTVMLLACSIQCQEIWSPEVDCSDVEKLSKDIICGDCLKVKYAIGSPSSSLESNRRVFDTLVLKARCTKCDYYIAKDEILSGNRAKNIGDNGCTWLSGKFFTNHPFYLILMLVLICLLTGLCVGILCCRGRKADTAVYKMTY